MPSFDLDFLIRFAITVFFVGLLSYGSYFRSTRNAPFAASFVLFGIGVFIVIYFLHGVDMSMGFAFGLFAVFTMLRYRTESISIKEMTYLFLVIAISLLTAVAQMGPVQMIMLNVLLCGTAFVVDSAFISDRYAKQFIQYERIENIKPERKAELFADLVQRTGLNIVSVKIENIDFLRDTAALEVTYRSQRKSADKETTAENQVGFVQ
jgi:hypothetical protein